MSPPRSAPARPPATALAMAQALAGSEPLTVLLERLAQSRAHLESLTTGLPTELRAAVRAGPLDDRQWVLLADDAAAAAKLRQMLPLLLAHANARGWPGEQVVVRVRPRAR